MSDPDMTTDQVQATRHQITFATSRSLAYLSVLELGTVWERTLRRAGIPLKYSQGYNPRPRMHFAAPLPVGCGSEADLLDVSLDAPLAPAAFRRMLEGITPRDLAVVDVTPVEESAPTLSDRLEEAEYRVWLQDADVAAIQSAVDTFIAADTVSLPRRGRRHRGKSYNLRPLVLTLAVDAGASAPWLGLQMRLNARPGATGRPDEVLKALALEDRPRRCTRTALILAPWVATTPED